MSQQKIEVGEQINHPLFGLGTVDTIYAIGDPEVQFEIDKGFGTRSIPMADIVKFLISNNAKFRIPTETKPFDDSSREESKMGRKRHRFQEPVLTDIDGTLLNFLLVNKDEGKVHIRIHWGHIIEVEARQYFEKVGLSGQTKTIRPLNSEMYGIAGTVWFPIPPSFIMSKMTFKYKTVGDVIEVNNVDLALGLMLLGFSADRSAIND